MYQVELLSLSGPLDQTDYMYMYLMVVGALGTWSVVIECVHVRNTQL